MSEETKNVTLYQQKDQEGNPVAPLVPERGIYDENGERLDDKLKSVNLKSVGDAVAAGVETIKKEGDTQVAEVQKQLPTLKHQIGLDKYKEFNGSTNYKVGDVVLKEGHLYKYKVAHVAGAWNPQEVYEVSMEQDMDERKFDKNKVVQESGEAEDKVMSQKAVSNKFSDLSNQKEKDRLLVGDIATYTTDYIFSKNGSTKKSESIIITQEDGYYDSDGKKIISDTYVCAKISLKEAFNAIKVKFSVGSSYIAKAFFSFEEKPISFISNITGDYLSFVIPHGAQYLYVSSRKLSDSYIPGVPIIEASFENYDINKFIDDNDLIPIKNRLTSLENDSFQQRYFNGLFGNNGVSPEVSDYSLLREDNKYYNNDGTTGESVNFSCAKMDVTAFRGTWLLIEGCFFGNTFAAKSFFLLEDDKRTYISNEGFLQKYIFVPTKATTMYLSNRKYDVTSLVVGPCKGVEKIRVFYNVQGLPSLLDMRAYVNLDARLASLENAESEIPKRSNKMFHFSLDDFKDSIADLVNNKDTYNSIFDNPTFKQLKEWHDKYGIVISLYVQRTLADIPSKFTPDFINNKDWLKFGFHGSGPSWEIATYDNGKQWWNDFVEGVMASIGNYEVIDRVPRNDYFHGTLNSCKGERDANCGCLGFLGCDDWGYNAAVRKNNYYLSSDESVFLDSRDRFIDYENQLTIFKTDFRLEQVATRWTNVDKCLAYYESAQAASQAFDLIVFSHEWNFTSYKSIAEKIFSWAKNKGYVFDYPMNKILGGYNG